MMRRILALTIALVVVLFSGATAALATHRPDHQETPSCDPHPQSGGDQNKHCEPAPAPTTPAPAPTEPPTGGAGAPTPAPPTGPAGGGGGGGGGGGRGPVAEPPEAVPGELPFTGLDLPASVALMAVLLALGGAALVLGRRRTTV
jgi:hypothetical protein